MGAFEEAARDAWTVGLNPVPWPLCSDDRDRPWVRWQPYQRKRVEEGALRDWLRRYGDKNLATTTGGPTGVLLVDVDPDPKDPGADDFVRRALDRFGDTPLIARTPGGGVHAWFAMPGTVGTRDGLVLEQTPTGEHRIDLKADRGFARLPPSARDGTPGFRWERGDWETFRRLPTPRPGSIPPDLLDGPRKAAEAPSGPPDGVRKGTRNRALHKHLVAVARACGSEAQLIEEAGRWNAALAEPLGTPEVLKTVRSVWGWVLDGNLWGGEPMTGIPATALRKLDADAYFLLAQLRHAHAGLRGEFAISPPAMAAALGWRKPRFMKARDALVTAGYLVRTHQGGAGKHDPARFRFAP